MKTLSKPELSALCDAYGALLTEKQREALITYCDFDFSLAEIAEQTGISRQGVRDSIVSGEKTLIQLENSLKMVQNARKLSDILQQVDSLIGVDDEAAKKLVQTLIKD